MADVPPEMFEQARLGPTLEAAKEYGVEHLDEFGGVYLARDPVRVVFLATARLDRHREALRDRVSHPDRVEVRRGRHTERQIRVWLDEVYQRLHDRSQALSVTSWGEGLGEAGFTVQVTIWPWSEDAADRIRSELAPIPIEVEAMPPPTRFARTRTATHTRSQ
jgi:hypothetical protein